MAKFFASYTITLIILLSLVGFNLNSITDLINSPSNVYYFQTSVTYDPGFLKVPYVNCVSSDKGNPYDNCMQSQLWMKINTNTLTST
jgi:hypothetical protein